MAEQRISAGELALNDFEVRVEAVDRGADYRPEIQIIFDGPGLLVRVDFHDGEVRQVRELLERGRLLALGLRSDVPEASVG